MRNGLKVVGVLSLGLLFGCSGAKVLTNPDVTFPIAYSEESPAFLFPINLGHLGSGGDTTAMGITVTAGVAAHFGKTVISGQQLFDLVGNLSYELAEAIQGQAHSNSWAMSGGAEPIASQMAQIMEKIVQGLVQAKLLDKPIKFKNIIALHSHGESAMGGTMLSVLSWGGIYDAETKQILSFIESKDSYVNKPEAVMAQLPSVYNGIIEKLLSGGVEKKK